MSGERDPQRVDIAPRAAEDGFDEPEEPRHEVRRDERAQPVVELPSDRAVTERQPMGDLHRLEVFVGVVEAGKEEDGGDADRQRQQENRQEAAPGAV